MEVRSVKVGYLEENCYIISHNNTCIIVDPGDQFYTIEEQMGDNKLIGILVTHGHPDHIGAVEKLVKTYHVNVFDRHNLEEKKYSIGDFNFEVIYTPGHTEDSITFNFYEYNFMFTGDFLFKGTIGRTDMEGGNQDEMNNSLNKIKNYDDNIKIYPGHGEITNLGVEKATNPFIK